MATAKRGDKKGPPKFKAYCAVCAATGRQVEKTVIKYAGYGALQGFYWTCNENSEHVERSKR